MLQRIQSVFLALVTIAMGAYITLPLWEKFSSDGLQSVSLTSTRFTHQLNQVQSEVDSVLYLAILAGIIGVIAAYAITRFRSRLVQSGLCAANSILMTALLAATIYQTWYKGVKL